MIGEWRRREKWRMEVEIRGGKRSGERKKIGGGKRSEKRKRNAGGKRTLVGKIGLNKGI